MNLILVAASELAADNSVTLQDDRARHVRQVLNAVPGQAIRIGVIDGALGTGTVIGLDARTVTLSCAFSDPPLPPRADLLLALPRPKVLRRLWAQLAALGVGRIILTNAARVERHYFDTHVLEPACYRPLLIEGLQQARDTRVPLVSVHRQFRVLIEDDLDAIAGDTTRIVAHPGATASVREVAASAPSRVLLAVGPEGGWNDFELRLLEARGFQHGSVGARTLRSDTACIALLAIVNDALGPD